MVLSHHGFCEPTEQTGLIYVAVLIAAKEFDFPLGHGGGAHNRYT